MKAKPSLKTLTAITLTCLLGCGSDKSVNHVDQTSVSTPSPSGNPNPNPSRIPDPKVLYTLKDDSAARKDERTRFLSEQILNCFDRPDRNGLNRYLCDLNTNRAKFNNSTMPRSPIFADYSAVNLQIVSISASLPDAFSNNLPESMKEQIRLNPPESLEIFWNVQSNPIEEQIYSDKIPTHGTPGSLIPIEWPIQSADGALQIKAHYWAEPTAEFGDPNAPEELFHRAMSMRLFEPLDDVTFQLNTQSFIDVDVYIHGGNNISPGGVGQINIDVLKTVPHTAFWSYVYDNKAPEGKRRAVATLHWMINGLDYEVLSQKLRNSQGRLTLKGLSEDLATPTSFQANIWTYTYDSAGKFSPRSLMKPALFQRDLNLKRLLPSLTKLIKE